MEDEIENLKTVLDILDEESNEEPRSEHSPICSETSTTSDKAVVSALESLSLNPIIFEKVKLSLGL